MPPLPAVVELRQTIAHGLDRLNDEHGGRYMAEVARTLKVERSTVGRWRSQQSTASPTHCELLAQHWPNCFDHNQLAALQYQTLGTAGSHLSTAVSHVATVDILRTPIQTYQAATDCLSIDPAREEDRVYLHAAMHLDRSGDSEIESDPLLDENTSQAVQQFRKVVARRSEEGWRIQIVISAGRTSRLGSIENMIHSIDGPNVDILAYPFRLPLVLAPTVIANEFVQVVHDHRRWERPDSALFVRSRSIAEWTTRFFTDLAADAPFHLRSPAGFDAAEFKRFSESLR